ncbi:hypothetical protein PY546_02790 [Providencia stuartii]|nr:hypothetical protein [Providencia stuartii]
MNKTAHYAAAFNVLGICYLFPPDDDSNRMAMRLFTLPGFAQQWPCEVDSTLCMQLSRTAAEGGGGTEIGMAISVRRTWDVTGATLGLGVSRCGRIVAGGIRLLR